ncbi:unnamed protein product [Schistosoma rodhaini]|uniref:RRM domain-containing protein n=1 Tax=Schistosoma rodhaini TaxID=6188 RepID=A0AA85G816_9TREM|nr:unnamed protein product [Schistosoma rodhaini]
MNSTVNSMKSEDLTPLDHLSNVNQDENIDICMNRKHKCSDSCNNEENEPSEAKRQCLSSVHSSNNVTDGIKTNYKFKYWLVFTVVTAGKQGCELGSDQTPVIQFNGILGDFFENKIVDRIKISIRPENFARTYRSSIELINNKSQLQSNITSNNELKSDYFFSPWNSCNNKINELTPTNTMKLITSVESPKYTSAVHGVNISTEALEAAGLQDITEYELDGLSFRESIIKISNWLKDHGVLDDQLPNDKSNILLIAENHQSIRNVIHAEAAYRNVDHELMNCSPWSVYIDLIESCQQFLLQSNDFNDDVGDKGVTEQKENKEHPLHNIFEAARALKIDWEETELANIKAELMSNIVIELTKKGYQVKDPEYVRYNYEHKTFSRKLKIMDSQVVEIRQVPWTATPATIAHYFTGLNVHPGGVAIRLTDGRRSNTAIVAFDDSKNAQLALARNQHHLCGSLITDIGSSTSDVHTTSSSTSSNNPVTNNSNLTNQNCANSRSECSTDSIQQIISGSMKPMYLQIHAASGKEFVQCTGCDQESVINFLNQLTNGEQVVVRVRGLPYTTCKKQIIEFFNAVQAPIMFNEQGIYLVVYPDQRPTGDAFILFCNDHIATKALIRHKDYLGDRYVELFKASPSEMVQVCHNVTLLQCSPSGQKTHSALSNIQSNGIIGVPLMNGGTQINCSNLVNFVNNSNTNNSIHKETYLSQALTHLKSAISTGALSNVQNLWHSGTMSLGLPHNLLTSTRTGLDSSGLNDNVLLNNTLRGISPFIPVISPNNPSVNLNLLPNITSTNSLFRDLTDPTDPDCPFARPMPIGGACAMVQLNELPMETSRHDIRLYLGPANFAKVYRMRRMEMITNHNNTSSWLLSLKNTIEAIQFIQDLITRSFGLTKLYGNNNHNHNPQFTVIPNIPTFALYTIDQNGKLSVVNLSDTSLCIPIHRIHISSLLNGSNGPSKSPNLNWSSKTMKHTIKTKLDDQNILNAMTSRVQLSDPTLTLKHSSSFIKNFDISNYVNTISSFNLSPTITLHNNENLLIPSNLISLYSTDNLKDLYHVNNISNVQFQCNLPNFTESMVMLTGLPVDVTQDELGSLFKPVKNLLTAQPYFIPFQYHPNGTANFLANFNNPLDAQTAVRYCPNGSLRSNKYVIGAACLIPPTNVTTITNHSNYITPSSSLSSSSSSSSSSTPIVPVNATNMLTSGFLNNDLLSSGIFLLPSIPSPIQQNRLYFQ